MGSLSPSSFLITATLKAWLYEHRKNPYPTKNEKMVLAMVTKMTLTQVSTWFANARRRLKKENKLHRTAANSRSEEEEDEDDDEDDEDEDVVDDDEDENENESHVDIEEEQAIQTSNGKNLKRKRDTDDDQAAISRPAPPTARPKIWSLVDVVQSNESKRSTGSSSSPHIIHPYITPSIPYLLYPSVSTSSPSHSSEHSSHSLLSPISSASTSASCSPAK